MSEIVTVQSLTDLQHDGLFAWSCFTGQYITQEG